MQFGNRAKAAKTLDSLSAVAFIFSFDSGSRFQIEAEFPRGRNATRIYGFQLGPGTGFLPFDRGAARPDPGSWQGGRMLPIPGIRYTAVFFFDEALLILLDDKGHYLERSFTKEAGDAADFAVVVSAGALRLNEYREYGTGGSP
jgi:hypothetical protein